ncbi:MAG: acyltransferase [Acetobacterales bacterium]
MRFLALLLGRWVYRPFSLLVVALLRLRGVSVGRRFYIEGVPRLKIRGRAGNIVIGDEVSVFGPIDLRNRENGRIVIEDDVKIDEHCRLVAANDATLRICAGADLGNYLTFNCGTDVTVGRDVLIAGFCLVQSSNHRIAPDLPIKQQPHEYGPVTISDGAWIGAHAIVLPGVTIGRGAVIAAAAVVSRDVGEQDIVAGVPARAIGNRANRPEQRKDR